MYESINFPNLHIYLEHVGKSITIGGFEIAYYGIIIAVGMLCGVGLACREAKRTGQNPDTYFDLAIVAIIFSLLGARLYYVAFRWDLYQDDLLRIFNVRQGGLAIYGGVIAAILTTFVFAKRKNLNFPLLSDTAGLGLVLGQIIGRWGNFFNREAFGGYSDGLFAMQIPIEAVRSADVSAELMEHIVNVDGIQYIQVHPTFLYESLWNLALLCILLLFVRKHKKFDGEVFLTYLLGYGLGRFWIESLRTDQLWLPGTSVPVSMLVAGAAAVISTVCIVIGRKNALRKSA